MSERVIRNKRVNFKIEPHLKKIWDEEAEKRGISTTQLLINSAFYYINEGKKYATNR
jgi:hypothetical protein